MGISLSFRREKLEGHETPQPGVLGLVHHPISSSAKLLDNAISRRRRVAVGRCPWVLHSRRILEVSIHLKSIKRDSHQSVRHDSHQLLPFLTHCRTNGLGNWAALRVPGAFSWMINAQDGQVKCRFKCPLPAQKQIDKSLLPSRQYANGWLCGRSATSLLSRKTRCRAQTPPRQRAKRTREDATGRGAG